MGLNEMEARKQLERIPPARSEIQNLVAAAKKQLRDAKVAGLSLETKLVLAYQVIVVCARTALRANGYRVTLALGEHALTLETLAFTVRSSKKLIAYFQALRKKRHDDLYKGTLHVSATESTEAVARAEQLQRETVAYLKKNFKQLLGG